MTETPYNNLPESYYGNLSDANRKIAELEKVAYQTEQELTTMHSKIRSMAIALWLFLGVLAAIFLWLFEEVGTK